MSAVSIYTGYCMKQHNRLFAPIMAIMVILSSCSKESLTLSTDQANTSKTEDAGFVYLESNESRATPLSSINNTKTVHLNITPPLKPEVPEQEMIWEVRDQLFLMLTIPACLQ